MKKNNWHEIKDQLIEIQRIETGSNSTSLNEIEKNNNSNERNIHRLALDNSPERISNIEPDRDFVKDEIERIRKEIGISIDVNLDERKQSLQENLMLESRNALKTGNYEQVQKIKKEIDFINDIGETEKPINLKTFLIMKKIFGKKTNRKEVEEYIINNSALNSEECQNYDIDRLVEICDEIVQSRQA